MPLLYGIHDREGRHIVPPDGWCVDVLALSENPPPADYNALRGDINWIVRFQWGFGTTGTIPLPKDDNLYFDRLAHYVHNSKGAHIWIIGNEVQHEQERPDGVFITPQRYADFFLRARTLIKVINSSHQVLPSPMAPYHANPVDWLAYWHDMLRIIEGNGGCDGIAVHAYTRSSNPDDINDDARMGPPLEDQCSGFLTYQDALEEVPATLRHLPAYITEFNELLDGGWDDRNTGVVQEAYSHINWWNTHAADANDLKVQCLILYRWPKFDKWHIEGKNGVIDDFRAAVARGYTSPVQGKEQMTTHIPVVTPGSPPAEPSLPPRQIDQRLLDRDTKVMDAKVQPGMEYWRLVRARWFDEQESQGRHHIYVETLDEQGKPVADVLFVVAWPSGSTESRTKGGLGFDAGNVPMSPGRNSFTVSVPLSDLVTGIGMGQDYPDGFNAGVHTSTLLTYQLATVPAATVPTQPPIVSPGPQPVPPPQPPVKPVEPAPSTPTEIIEPRVAQAILRVESGGRTHGEDGRIIIRFEAHIFKTYLKNDALWAEHFSANAQRPWMNQQWRADPNGAWLPIHTGKQADEWAAFEFANNQLSTPASFMAISMGAGQIMGFNFARIGYPSAADMYVAFRDAQVQTIGFINFFLSDPALADAMRRKDWREIAKRYNGSGAVDTYAPLLEKAYKELGG